MKKDLLFMLVFLILSACNPDQVPPPTAAEPLPTASKAVLAVPLATQTAVSLLAFIDSGQRLGNGRSWDVSSGDLDGDGDMDVVVANSVEGRAGSEVWLNDGRGVFTSQPQELGYGMGLDLGDLDGDGDLDVFIVGWYEAGEVWLNDGTGIFTDSGQSLGTPGGWDVALGDLDGDGDLDAFMAHEKADMVWLNDGNGIFYDSVQSLGTTYTATVGLADMDGDGDIDAVAVGWGEPGKLWLNDSMGHFSDSGQTLSAGHVHIHGVALGDLTGNGAVDAVTSGSLSDVWLNDGTGNFSGSTQTLTSWPGDTAALEDIDQDGDLDIYLAVGTADDSPDEIWLNDGQGHFMDSDLVLSTEFTSGIALEDLDRDGDLDVFVTHGKLGLASGGEMPNEVWLNTLH